MTLRDYSRGFHILDGGNVRTRVDIRPLIRTICTSVNVARLWCSTSGSESLKGIDWLIHHTTLAVIATTIDSKLAIFEKRVAGAVDYRAACI